MFIGFVESGVPLGVTFSFLISSPMVNEVALVLLLGLFGWKVALFYALAGVTVAIVGGLAIGALGLESSVEPYVYAPAGESDPKMPPTWPQRFEKAWHYSTGILKATWPWIVAGTAIGAAIRGYIPSDFLVTYAGRGNPLAVPVAVLVGIPLYGGEGSIIPVVKALMDKGLPIGTVLAFMMAVTAISLPELIILRRVLKPRLLATFVGICTVTMIAVGYLFNWILA
jgi:uncharacterized membrane protein YraQ (UPF0718 family)